MANVYSKLLGASIAFTGTITLGTVPTGSVWVVRHVSWFWTGFPWMGGTGAWLETASTGPFMGVPVPPVGKLQYNVDGHQVLNAGDALEASTGDPFGWDVRVSGYQLTLP